MKERSEDSMSLATNVLQPIARQLIVKTMLVAAFVVTIDEALKALVRQTMATCTAHDAVGCDYLNAGGAAGILHVENAGSALGFVQGSWAWLAVAALGLVLIPLCGRSARRGSLAVGPG